MAYSIFFDAGLSSGTKKKAPHEAGAFPSLPNPPVLREVPACPQSRPEISPRYHIPKVSPF